MVFYYISHNSTGATRQGHNWRTGGAGLCCHHTSYVERKRRLEEKVGAWEEQVSQRIITSISWLLFKKKILEPNMNSRGPKRMWIHAVFCRGQQSKSTPELKWETELSLFCPTRGKGGGRICLGGVRTKEDKTGKKIPHVGFFCFCF